MTTEEIGLGAATYDTPQQWWDSRGTANVLSDSEIGACLAEEFTAAFDFNGKTTTSTFYGHLMAKAGAEHDGRHHALSGLGNARFNHAGAVTTVRLRDDHIRVSWMEIKGPGNNNLAAARVEVGFITAGGILHVHHNIIHNDGASTATDNSGFMCDDADMLVYCYRNIIFGVGGTGLRTDQGASGSVMFYNTVYANNRSYAGSDNSRGGIAVGSGGDANYAMRYNAAFSNGNLDIRLTRGVQNYNFTGDGTGDDEGAQSQANLSGSIASIFTNPTTTWASTDLRLLATASPLIGAGVSESSSTYPEINVPINNRSYTITGAWDIGAAQYISAATKAPLPRKYSKMRALSHF